MKDGFLTSLAMIAAYMVIGLLLTNGASALGMDPLDAMLLGLFSTIALAGLTIYILINSKNKLQAEKDGIEQAANSFAIVVAHDNSDMLDSWWKMNTFDNRSDFFKRCQLIFEQCVTDRQIATLHMVAVSRNREELLEGLLIDALKMNAAMHGTSKIKRQDAEIDAVREHAKSMRVLTAEQVLRIARFGELDPRHIRDLLNEHGDADGLNEVVQRFTEWLNENHDATHRRVMTDFVFGNPEGKETLTANPYKPKE